jgi:hypothetical protein
MRFRSLCAFSAAFLALLSASVISRVDNPAILPYVVFIAVGSALVTALLWRAQTFSPKAVLGGAIILHCVALAGIPAFEDDYYRFIWDGWQIATFGTPYGTPPEAFFGKDSIPTALGHVLSCRNAFMGLEARLCLRQPSFDRADAA